MYNNVYSYFMILLFLFLFTLNSEYIINTKYIQPLIILAACIHQIKENCYNRRWNLSGIGLFSFDWKFFLLGFDDKLDFILRTPQLKSAIWGKKNFLTHLHSFMAEYEFKTLSSASP